MRNLYALRFARGAGRVNHVSQVLRTDSLARIFLVFARNQFPFAVEADEARAALGQSLEQSPLRHHDRRLGILQHEGQPFLGIRGVEREISTAGFEDAEQADHQVQGAVQTNADERVRLHAELSEMMRQLVRALVEFTIRQMLLAEDDRHGVRRARGLRFIECGDGFLLRVSGLCPVAFNEQPVSLGFGQQRQL